MRKTVIIVLFMAIIVIAIEGIVESVKKSLEERKRIGDTEIIENLEITEDMDRPDEEYVSIFLNNREDFDYVAEIMTQWPERSIIDLEDSISCKDQELADEIEKNEEFYKHLKNLHDLGEVSDIIKLKTKIEFGLGKPPLGYSRSGWYYWEDMEEKEIFSTVVIDEHWSLEIVPNT